MPWGWSVKPVALGGALGTPDEARQTGAWPDYEAEYLKTRMARASGRFNAAPLGAQAKQVYLDHVSQNYKEEAEACLKSEFNDWLQGKHEANRDPQPYQNGPGRPVRRHVWGDMGNIDQWRPTNWGTAQLTHLPGVREYLRDMAKHKDKAELQMNILAECGPQNLEEAWMYFKHWVKRRPVETDECIQPAENHELGARSNFGREQPHPIGAEETRTMPVSTPRKETPLTETMTPHHRPTTPHTRNQRVTPLSLSYSDVRTPESSRTVQSFPSEGSSEDPAHSMRPLIATPNFIGGIPAHPLRPLIAGGPHKSYKGKHTRFE